MAALVKRVYVSLVGTRRDHSVCAVGRSGTGKTTACQTFTHALLKQAGTSGENVSGEKKKQKHVRISAQTLQNFIFFFPLVIPHFSGACAGHVHDPQGVWLCQLPAQ